MMMMMKQTTSDKTTDMQFRRPYHYTNHCKHVAVKLQCKHALSPHKCFQCRPNGSRIFMSLVSKQNRRFPLVYVLDILDTQSLGSVTMSITPMFSMLPSFDFTSSFRLLEQRLTACITGVTVGSSAAWKSPLNFPIPSKRSA